MDASVTPIMSAAQLYGSGMTWTWNPHRIIFNKVNSCAQVLPDGTTVPLENDKLYRVVTGLYSGQMLGTVNSQSFGILTITPKDANGNVITNFEDHIIYNPDGSEVKEWYALASYLQSMGTVDARYFRSGRAQGGGALLESHQSAERPQSHRRYRPGGSAGGDPAGCPPDLPHRHPETAQRQLAQRLSPLSRIMNKKPLCRSMNLRQSGFFLSFGAD